MLTLEPVHAPFTVLIDSQESLPFTFDGLKADADKQHRPLVVPTRWCSLGRHPHSLGDYAIEGFTGRCHVERKSLEDAQGTVLGWPTGHDKDRDLEGRRERFKCELQNLATIEAGIVIVEATLPDCLRFMPGIDSPDAAKRFGSRTCAENSKYFYRSVLSWQQRYTGCQWHFAGSRRLAEVATFRWLEFFYKRHRTEIAA